MMGGRTSDAAGVIRWPRGGQVPVSAEIRWFWRGAWPPSVEAWFRTREVPAGGGKSRTDEYLVDRNQLELGLKKRGRKTGIEIKGLVGIRRAVSIPFDGRVQIWSKWTSEA